MFSRLHRLSTPSLGKFQSIAALQTRQFNPPPPPPPASKSPPPKSPSANIFVIYYSLYGHVRTLAEEIGKGIEDAGCKPSVFQVQELLPADLIKKLGGTHQDQFVKDHPIINSRIQELPNADGFLFGTPTRFGMMCSQMKNFWDATGSLWMSGKLIGKPAGIFFSTGTQGGGQETTAFTTVTQLTHHGMLFVPMGYGNPNLINMNEIHGGSPYGPGTYAGDGSRKVSDLEKEMARYHGKQVAQVCLALKKGKAQ